MKVTLRKAGLVVGELTVESNGAITIAAKGQLLSLSERASRRIAGEVLRKSLEHTARTMRGRAADVAKQEIDRLLGASADDDDET